MFDADAAVLDLIEADPVGKKPAKPPQRKKRPNRTKTPLNVEVDDKLREAVDLAAERERHKLRVIVEVALERYLTEVHPDLWPPKPEPGASHRERPG